MYPPCQGSFATMQSRLQLKLHISVDKKEQQMSENTAKILDALVAHVTPNMSSDMVDEGLTDAHHRLMTAIQTKMADNPDAWSMIQRYSEDPANWYGVTRDALHEAEAANDPEVLAATEEVLSYSEPLEPEVDPQDQLTEREISDMAMGQAPHFEEYLELDQE